MVNYRKISIYSGSSIATLFTILIMLSGAQITSNGDIICAGTLENPCVSLINITTNLTTYIYNKGDTKLEFLPGIKNYSLCIKDNRYSSSARKDITKYPCGQYFREIDFTEHPAKGRVYNFKFEKGRTYEFKLVGYKNNPTDNVKWTMFGAGGELDPLWGALEVNLTYPTNATTYQTYNGSIILTANVSTICWLNDSDWDLQGSRYSTVFNWYSTPSFGNFSIDYSCAYETDFEFLTLQDLHSTNDGTCTNYNLNHGAISGATWTSSGVYGGAYEFDGSSDYISFDNELSFNSTNGFTVAFWAQELEPLSGGNLIHVMSNSGSAFYESIYMHGDGTIKLTQTNTLQCTGSYTNDHALHYYSFSVMNNICTVREDGIDITVDSTFNSVWTPNKVGGTSYAMNGTLDEFRIWNNSALTQTEIQAEMNSHAPVKTDGLISWWSFNDKTRNSTHTYDTNNYATDGGSGEAARFDGVNKKIVLTNNINLSGSTSGYTIHIRLLPLSFVGGWFMPFGNTALTRYFGYANSVGFIINDGLGGDTIGTVPITTGIYQDWTLIENTTHTAVYVNGILQGTPVLRSGDFSVYEIGDVAPFGGTYDFNGSISNLGIWNRTLTQAEITELYNNWTYNPYDTLADDMVAYYSMNINDTWSDLNSDSFWFETERSINYTFGTNITDMWFYPNLSKFNFTTFTITDYNSSVVNQTNINPFLTVCNNGTVSGELDMWLNQSSVLNDMELNYTVTGAEKQKIDDCRFGECYNYSGSQCDDGTYLLYAADRPSLDIRQDLTMSAWIKTPPDVSTNTRRFIIAAKDYVSISTSHQTYGMLILNSKIRVDVGNNTYSFYTSSNNLIDSTWYHVTMRLNSSDLCVFINGSKISCEPRPSGFLIKDSNVGFMIGQNTGGVSTVWRCPYNGIIDEVRLWNASKSTAFIQADMLRYMPDNSSGDLVLYAGFGDVHNKVKCNTINEPSSATTIWTSNSTLNISFSGNSCNNVYCWMDWLNASEGFNFNWNVSIG